MATLLIKPFVYDAMSHTWEITPTTVAAGDTVFFTIPQQVIGKLSTIGVYPASGGTANVWTSLDPKANIEANFLAGTGLDWDEAALLKGITPASAQKYDVFGGGIKGFKVTATGGAVVIKGSIV